MYLLIRIYQRVMTQLKIKLNLKVLNFELTEICEPNLTLKALMKTSQIRIKLNMNGVILELTRTFVKKQIWKQIKLVENLLISNAVITEWEEPHDDPR